MPGQSPSFVRESLWQMPDACTLIRTRPVPGSGTSRSTISIGPLALVTCAAFILGIVDSSSANRRPRIRWRPRPAEECRAARGVGSPRAWHGKRSAKGAPRREGALGRSAQRAAG